MAYKFNVFTGSLDIVGKASSGTGGVTRIGATNDRRITIWAGNSSDTVQDSKASIQESGAIQAQGFITDRHVNGTVAVSATESWISPSLEMQPGSTIVLAAGAQLIII